MDTSKLIALTEFMHELHINNVNKFSHCISNTNDLNPDNITSHCQKSQCDKCIFNDRNAPSVSEAYEYLYPHITQMGK
jgi:hypothetical protein